MLAAVVVAGGITAGGGVPGDPDESRRGDEVIDSGEERERGHHAGHAGSCPSLHE